MAKKVKKNVVQVVD